MSYNKYNTRNSGRFNTPGQFVAAAEGGFGSSPAPASVLQPVQYNKPQIAPSNTPMQNFATFPSPATPQPLPNLAVASQDLEMKAEQSPDVAEDGRPPWMKSRLQGIRKISNKERRRRQNENLRRLLTPKSALMVLNEIVPKEQVSNQFVVESVGPAGNQYYRTNATQSFCADLTLEGNNYKGYGETKVTARNAAAEQAVRDLILRKMSKVLLPETAEGAPEEEEPSAADANAETLPMIQLASFALHKLFSEWECEGHRVPQLRTNTGVAVSECVSEPEVEPPAPRKKPPKKKELPADAAAMHPSTLLAFMRPQLEYRELGAEGDRPQNMMFTMGIDVDGTTYMGKACNKKEARKQAARAACTALFGVKYD